MAKIHNINDFKDYTSNITSFSHAYLFETNSLQNAYPYIKEFAKLIICGNNYDENDEDNKDICYKIDHDEFDDLYVVNPETIGINTSEITNLLTYMETKSLRTNGKRVYIIYGFERLSRDVSNKILKFLEEPNDNIYALLMTENIDRILSTIISRCQTINFTFDDEIKINENLDNMKRFITFLFQNHNKTIAYINNYFGNLLGNRALFYDCFNEIENILSKNINKKYGKDIDDNYQLECLDNMPICNIINILDITNRLKSLIKQNINLNLLLDRYIIEVTKELIACKEL